MHPGVNGKKFPDKPAVIMAGSEKVITHGELNELSNQGAHLFRSLGLKPGDSIAIMLENHYLFFPLVMVYLKQLSLIIDLYLYQFLPIHEEHFQPLGQ